MRVSIDVFQEDAFHTFSVDPSSPTICLFEEISKHFNLFGSYENLRLRYDGENLVITSNTPLVLLKAGVYGLQIKSDDSVRWDIIVLPQNRLQKVIKHKTRANNAYITSEQLGNLIVSEYFTPYIDFWRPLRNRLICKATNLAIISSDRFWQRFNLPIHRDLSKWVEKKRIQQDINDSLRAIRQLTDTLDDNYLQIACTKRKIDELQESVAKKVKTVIELQNKLALY